MERFEDVEKMWEKMWACRWRWVPTDAKVLDLERQKESEQVLTVRFSVILGTDYAWVSRNQRTPIRRGCFWGGVVYILLKPRIPWAVPPGLTPSGGGWGGAGDFVALANRSQSHQFLRVLVFSPLRWKLPGYQTDRVLCDCGGLDPDRACWSPGLLCLPSRHPLAARLGIPRVM